MPDISPASFAETSAIVFETTEDAARKLLPRFYELERPVITIYRLTYQGMNYLAGGEYREAVICVDASYNGPDETIKAPFGAVLWVDQVQALVSGRELLGSPKVHGRFPTEEVGPGSRSFEVYESDGYNINARLMRGEWSNLKELDAASLAKLNERIKITNTLGWKIIPSMDGPHDADYPTVIVMSWKFDQASYGEGRITFDTPDPQHAPVGSRIMRVLAGMPIKEYRTGLVARGTAVVERASTRRLAMPPGVV
jgi:hypothetical protein